MKVILILLALALPLSAKTPKPPAAASPISLEAPGRTLTAQQDIDLRQWIEGIMLANDQAQAEKTALQADLDSAKGEVTNLQGQLAETTASLTSGESAVIKLQADISELRKWGTDQEARADKAEEAIAKAQAQLKRFEKLVLYLALILASVASMYVFEMLKPAGILGKLLSATGPAIQYGAPVVVWLATFSAVEVYLKYVL